LEKFKFITSGESSKKFKYTWGSSGVFGESLKTSIMLGETPHQKWLSLRCILPTSLSSRSLKVAGAVVVAPAVEVAEAVVVLPNKRFVVRQLGAPHR
jgi:hypothetical protein